MSEVNQQPQPQDDAGSPASDCSPSWTPRTKKVLAMAAHAARIHGCPYIGVEHILYGLTKDDSNVSMMLLEAGITADSIAAKYQWKQSQCFCGGKGWVMLVGTGSANRKIACPDCAANTGAQAT